MTCFEWILVSKFLSQLLTKQNAVNYEMNVVISLEWHLLTAIEYILKSWFEGDFRAIIKLRHLLQYKSQSLNSTLIAY